MFEFNLLKQTKHDYLEHVKQEINLIYYFRIQTET